MKVMIAAVQARGDRRGREDGFGALAEIYLERLAQYASVEAKTFRSEAALLEGMERIRARTAPLLVLLDARGKMFSSEEFAAWIGRQRDGGTQNLVFAVGPADGWSEEARASTGFLLSLGAMTLPHELARLVLVEQVYRAFTILSNHPYHGGH